MGTGQGAHDEPLPQRVPATSGSITVNRPREYLGVDTPPQPVLEPSSQSVQTFPAVPAPSGGRRPNADARFLGLPLPAWIVGGALSLIAIIGSVVILPRLDRALSPQPRPADSGVAVIGPGATGGPSITPSDPAAGPSPDQGGSSGPGGGGTGGPGGGGTSGPGGLTLGFSAAPRGLGLTGWAVTVTIHNPTDADQTWLNVSVYVGGNAQSVQEVTAGIDAFVVGQLVCVVPVVQSVATVPAGGDATIEFTFGLLSGEPRRPTLDDENCRTAQG